MLKTITAHVNNSTGIAARNELLATADCVCPGENATYECTVHGGVLTVWSGSVFDDGCSILLNHSQFESGDEDGVCNNGTVVARGIRKENNYYTSQLTIFVSSNLTGRTIECHVYDEQHVTHFDATIELIPSSGVYYK